jgi:hypothetical protein
MSQYRLNEIAVSQNPFSEPGENSIDPDLTD